MIEAMGDDDGTTEVCEAIRKYAQRFKNTINAVKNWKHKVSTLMKKFGAETVRRAMNKLNIDTSSHSKEKLGWLHQFLHNYGGEAWVKADMLILLRQMLDESGWGSHATTIIMDTAEHGGFSMNEITDWLAKKSSAGSFSFNPTNSGNSDMALNLMDVSAMDGEGYCDVNVQFIHRMNRGKDEGKYKVVDKIYNYPGIPYIVPLTCADCGLYEGGKYGRHGALWLFKYMTEDWGNGFTPGGSR